MAEGVDHGAGGSFAVGAGDVNDLGPMRGEGEEFAKEAGGCFEAQLDSESLGGVEPIKGFLVVHGLRCFLRAENAEGRTGGGEG